MDLNVLLDNVAATSGASGILVFDRDWLVIGSRGDLSARDASQLERLLNWEACSIDGEVAWGDDGRTIQFNKARLHTLVLLKGKIESPIRPPAPSVAVSPASLPNITSVPLPSSLQTVKSAR
ncbi:hypothetical protein BD410DRAFT_796427 [Rickenella mellea]|uniref:Uncharacterized protein n=1 Tax=Rickenella mellea TaxID=50990 RepID=A0A4Y7PLD9_9AGAM|nr:hypothetical protein BD410DRAFT_796427 [Rickenella mellea]